MAGRSDCEHWPRVRWGVKFGWEVGISGKLSRIESQIWRRGVASIGRKWKVAFFFWGKWSKRVSWSVKGFALTCSLNFLAKNGKFSSAMNGNRRLMCGIHRG